MYNTTLVDNTDRIYGEQDQLKKVVRNEYMEVESEISIWAKLIGLMVMTYGLIVALYALS
jgi:hypothetical protein